MTKYVLDIVVTTKDPVSKTVMRAYVENAISGMVGSLRPPGAHGEEDLGDPMFGNIHKVRVRSVDMD